MWLRLTVDDELVVRAVEAVTEAGPFALCPDVTPRFSELEGLVIGRGWTRKVYERLGGVRGCTHLVELLRPAATVAYQTLAPVRRQADATGRKPAHIDQCHALRSDGPVVREHYPEWYTGTPPDGGAGGGGE